LKEKYDRAVEERSAEGKGNPSRRQLKQSFVFQSFIGNLLPVAISGQLKGFPRSIEFISHLRNLIPLPLLWFAFWSAIT